MPVSRQQHGRKVRLLAKGVRAAGPDADGIDVAMRRGEHGQQEVNVMGTALRNAWQVPVPATLDLRVEGADVRGLDDADIRRLFPEQVTGERLNRLRNWRRLVVRIDGRAVGIATYTQTPIETHVPDFAVVIPPSMEAQYENVSVQVLDSLLNAIEIASLAAGCHRVVLIPQGRVSQLERRGYSCVHERCGGSWMEKPLL